MGNQLIAPSEFGRSPLSPSHSTWMPHGAPQSRQSRAQSVTMFVFNQDWFFFSPPFSYKFASCKQVPKRPSFGETQVRSP